LIPGNSSSAATLERLDTQEGENKTKVRATFHLPMGLLEEARDAAVFLSGPPTRLTLADFAEKAFRQELERLKQEHRVGANFPKRQPGALRGGRPIGS